LLGSTLPNELRNAGNDVREIGESERIPPHAMMKKMTLTSSGTFEEMTPGSMKPVAEIRTHAGIARVLRYHFTLP
jgi:hypothetical protein